MPRKLKPYTAEEHEKFAKDIVQAIDILSPHLECLWQGYGVKSSQANQLHIILRKLSSTLLYRMEDKYYQIDDSDRDRKSPYSMLVIEGY